VPGEWEYLGIELYYKLYVPGEPLETSYTKHSELTAHGFYRLSSHPEENKTVALKPLIEIDTVVWDEDRDFTINLGDKTIKEESTVTEFVAEIRRGVLYYIDEDDGFFRRFLWVDPKARDWGFDKDHEDVSDSLDTYLNGPAPDNITVVMYALSYGRIEELYDLYSDAVYLGAQDYNFGW
jgi:hypothetical protein